MFVDTDSTTDDLFADNDGEEAEVEVEDLEEVVDEATGEAVQVTPAEAKRMGLFQQDYTRKTQELAARSKGVESLEAIRKIAEFNPVAAVEAFQNMLLAEGKLQLADPDDEDDERHPLERDRDALLARIEQVENDRRAEKFEASMVKAIAAQGLQIEVDELFQFMAENEIGSPTVAARFLALEGKGTAKAVAQETAIAVKRNLPPVHQGTGRQAPVDKANAMLDMDDAFALAVKQHSKR